MALKNTRDNIEPTESINLNKETGGYCSNISENSSEIKLDISRSKAAINSHPTTTTATTLSLFPPAMKPAGMPHLFHSSSSIHS